jgi:hypothetical protein
VLCNVETIKKCILLRSRFQRFIFEFDGFFNCGVILDSEFLPFKGTEL